MVLIVSRFSHLQRKWRLPRPFVASVAVVWPRETTHYCVTSAVSGSTRAAPLSAKKHTKNCKHYLIFNGHAPLWNVSHLLDVIHQKILRYYTQFITHINQIPGY